MLSLFAAQFVRLAPCQIAGNIKSHNSPATAKSYLVILNTFMPVRVAGALSFMLFPIMVLVLQLILFFRYPIMFLKKKNVIEAITSSVQYLLKNKKHVVIIWLMVLRFIRKELILI